MSSLVVSHNLHLMMLEIIVDKLSITNVTDIDSGVIQKTAIKFRIPNDNEWITLSSQHTDYTNYSDRITNEEKFYGGKSVIFTIPEIALKHKISDADIEIHVFKEISKYIEMKPYYSIGITKIPFDSLFNGIIKELNERLELHGYFNFYHEREPISRSIKDTYTITSENTPHFASISIYTRLNYFGKSIITEIERLPNGGFHVREETCEGQPYQCHEVSREELETGFWCVGGIQPSVNPRNLICICDMNIQSGVKAIAQAVNKHRQVTMTIEDVGEDNTNQNNFLNNDTADVIDKEKYHLNNGNGEKNLLFFTVNNNNTKFEVVNGNNERKAMIKKTKNTGRKISKTKAKK